MSYDISLYKPEFLRRALEQRLGDWTDADPIPPETIDVVVRWLASRGYKAESDHPDAGRCFIHPHEAWGVQVGVHRGSVAFTVPYWGGAVAAIIAAKTDAEELAESTGLALHDPQSGDGGASPVTHRRREPPSKVLAVALLVTHATLLALVLPHADWSRLSGVRAAFLVAFLLGFTVIVVWSLWQAFARRQRT